MSPSPLSERERWHLVAAGYVAENMVFFDAFAGEALRLVPPAGDVLGGWC